MIKDTKEALRRSSLAQRNSLSEDERANLSEKLTQYVKSLPALRNQTIAGYWPIGSEIDPRPLLRHAAKNGANLCLPAVINKTTIQFREWKNDDTLVEAGFGTFAPPPTAAIRAPDIIFIPLSAFDIEGNRIGYGKGYYDRAIASLYKQSRAPLLIGLAFSCQQINKVPIEPHDIPLHSILTPDGLMIIKEQNS